MVSDCAAFDDIAAVDVLCSCTRLTELRIISCGLASECILPALGRLSCLEKLELFQCSFLTDRCIHYLTRLTTLTRPELDGASGLSLECGNALMAALPSCDIDIGYYDIQ